MKTRHQSSLLVFGALALVGTGIAQVPSGNDTSDPNFNTGMGTGALGLTGANGGSFDTASGYDALLSNTTGFSNTAAGYEALRSNTVGTNNTAIGVSALYFNGGGIHNTASGVQALFANTHGNQNTASGFDALFSNKTGNNNSGFGYETLFHATTGTNNVALGWEAGFNLTTGSNNIDIGNQGAAGESGIIRIGTQEPSPLQTNTYIAGIYNNSSVTGLPVVIDSTGQLGVEATSSERFKTAIAPMGSNSSKLNQLRPVIFQYKADPQATQRYGLIAEEVAKVYPELVIRSKSGTIDGIRYDELAPMLLNEMQQQNKQTTAKIDAQAAQIRVLERQELATRTEQLRVQQQIVELKALNNELHTALRLLRDKDGLVAQR